MAERKLVLRLSSLGDVILASGVLTGADRPVDWVVAKEFAAILEGHPGIGKLWIFDRNQGLGGWWNLCHTLWREGYSEVFDLHATLRTRLAQILFRYWSWREPGSVGPDWSQVAKERLRFWGYCLFKNLWPRVFRPRPWRQRFAEVFSGKQTWATPNLIHLLRFPAESRRAALGLPRENSWVAVMPSSRWSGKQWSEASFVEVLKQSSFLPVVLGTTNDLASGKLVEALQTAGVKHVSGVGRWTLKETAEVLSLATLYLGVDTGLAHLAEAVGTPAVVIYGPTRPDQGFGPWRPESRSIEASILCRPCGKDGRYCYRWDAPYQCLQTLRPAEVLKVLRSFEKRV